MTLDLMYHIICNELGPLHGEREAQAIARLLLEHQCDATMVDIMMGRQAQNWDPKLLERLKTGEPIQYVLGKTQFHGLCIEVDGNVLIPRPETERLVDWALEQKGQSVLDVCTGSGCIALSIKHDNPNKSVEAWDISTEALKKAAQNLQRHQTDVTLRQMNLLDEATWPQGTFDIIVSNPPYICLQEQTQMEAHVLNHEPHLALFVPDEEPLLFYRPLALLARERLTAYGTIMVECNTAYTEQVAQCFAQQGLTAITIENDCYGKPRFVSAQQNV